MLSIDLPLAGAADRMLAALAGAADARCFAMLDGATLLGERAMLGGLRVPGQRSAGGGCWLFEAADGTIALNLARAADRELLPALFETDELNAEDHQAIAARIARSGAAPLLRRARLLGLAAAAEREMPSGAANPCTELVRGPPAPAERRKTPRIADLSALWAGPLAAHLLQYAGADVVKVESRTRPDAMRAGDAQFYALLNQGKASVVLDFADSSDRQALLALIAGSDIVIEAARPRALAQLGIDAAQIVRDQPGLVWITITAHGAEGEEAGWVGFGDDCGVAGGLTAALRAAGGRAGFVGDAIADPLTGLLAARVAWDAWSSRRGGRFALAMSHVVAHSLATARDQDPQRLECSLRAWSAAAGQPFPPVNRRPIGALPALGEHTRSWLERVRCA